MVQHACRFIVLLLLASAALAQSREPFYVGTAEISIERILAPPPAPDSQAQKDDLRAVLDVQRTRSEADVKEAQADAELSPFRFADVLGPEFRADKLPLTAKLLRQALADSGRISSVAKAHFDRPRPFAASSEVNPVLGRTLNASYPSGHSAYGYTVGMLLALMVPEKSAELFERGVRYGHNRIVAGVHYPTDIEAGRICAALTVNALLHNQKFLADFEPAKAELRAVLGLK